MLRCLSKPSSLLRLRLTNFPSLARNRFWVSHRTLVSVQRPPISSGNLSNSQFPTINYVVGFISKKAVHWHSESIAACPRRVVIRPMSMSISTSVPVTEEVDPVKLLTGVNDDYGGVIAELKEPMEPVAFVSVLRASISRWREQGKRGIWIKVPIEFVNLVEPAVKEGFWFHHAESNFLMLVYWIPQGAHTIPANATHRVGVGAVVLNENNEVLVVQEMTGKFQGTGVWKFPTGVVDEGEDICVAAVREVKEETGVDAEFVEVLAFRQSHQSFFQKSDLFFVCMMRPVSHEIKKQHLEIEAAQWMPFEEYAAQPFNQKHELLRYIIDMCLSKKDGKYIGFTPVPTASPFSTQNNFLYLNHHSLRQQQ